MKNVKNEIKSSIQMHVYEHSSLNFESYRQIGDTPADQLVEKILSSDNKHELYALLGARSWDELNFGQIRDEALKDFVFDHNKLPTWADKSRMAEASKLFRNNGNEFLFLLGIVSLPYCYAAAKGAISLYHTEKIRKNTELRLLDTTTFVVDLMAEDAFKESGEGFLAIKQVRLRHAMARYYLNRVPQIRQLGEVPINQEDMAGTNLAFSYIALRALPKVGVSVSREIQEAYLHFWSMIGFLMGIDERLLAEDLRTAFYLEKKIATRQFKVSEEGRALTRQLIDHYQQAIPNKATTAIIRPMMKYMNGPVVSEIIGLFPEKPLFDISFLMHMLPLFKRFVFPPFQSYQEIVNQLESKRAETRKNDQLG